MKKMFIISLAAILLVIQVASIALAGVNASYIKKGAKKVDIAVSISNPAPKAIIVKQQVPSGNRLVSSSPQSKGANNKDATWMFKRIKTGMITIKMQFEKDVQTEALHGEIRFKERGSGDMITKKIQ